MDACTGNFGDSDFCVYVSRLKQKTFPLWTVNNPIAYNSTFPCVVWSDGSNTMIPQERVFTWLDFTTVAVLEDHNEIED